MLLYSKPPNFKNHWSYAFILPPPYNFMVYTATTYLPFMYLKTDFLSLRQSHECAQLQVVLSQIFSYTLLSSKQKIAKIPDWPRRKAVAEFRLCVGHDCLGTHLHRTGIRPDPYYMLCSLCEPMDRNHLGQCTALLNRTECERYWEARIKMVEY